MKTFFTITFLLISAPYLWAQNSYNGVIDDIPVELVVDLNGNSPKGAKIRYRAENNFISLEGTKGSGYAPEGSIGNGDYIMFWNQQEDVSIFLRDVSSAFGKPNKSVYIGTIRGYEQYNQPSERPNVVFFLNK